VHEPEDVKGVTVIGGPAHDDVVVASDHDHHDSDDDDDDDWVDPHAPRPGMTGGGGRIVIDEHLRGALWAGRQLGPRERAVIVLVRGFDYVRGKAVLDEWYRYEVPGIAPLAFLGYPDGLAPSATPEPIAPGAVRAVPPAMIAEVLPDGVPLAAAEPPLTDAEVIRIGIALCEVLAAWIAQAPWVSQGLAPETVYVAGEPGSRYFAGATPRVYALDDRAGWGGAFSAELYGGPMSGTTELSVEDATFMVAQVIWFAATREHPYVWPARTKALDNMEHDRRRPFTGTAELGALLERVLVFDESRRIDLTELRAGLVELARQWSVELPPFPPPGLAE
jgi:hypothetical protein